MNKVNKDIGSKKYLHSREVFRDRARKEFGDHNVHAMPLIRVINDYVAATVLGLSGCDLTSISNAQYTADLIVSFARTHFVVIDLIVCSELIEASTLLRKQFELVARLNELGDAKSVEKLLRKTPKLAALRTKIKRLYSEYSEISHSASPVPLELLGRIYDEEHYWTVAYPEFSRNAYVSLNHAAVSVFEYYYWAHEFFSRHIGSYDQTWGEGWILAALEKHRLMCELIEESSQ